MNGDTESFLKAQLDKPPEDSKKWRMAMYGLKGVALFVGLAYALICFRPELASQVASITQMALTAWGAVVAVFLGAQGSVDFKSTSALVATTENKKEEGHQVVEYTERTPMPKEFDDGTI